MKKIYGKHSVMENMIIFMKNVDSNFNQKKKTHLKILKYIYMFKVYKFYVMLSTLKYR